MLISGVLLFGSSVAFATCVRYSRTAPAGPGDVRIAVAQDRAGQQAAVRQVSGGIRRIAEELVDLKAGPVVRLGFTARPPAAAGAAGLAGCGDAAGAGAGACARAAKVAPVTAPSPMTRNGRMRFMSMSFESQFTVDVARVRSRLRPATLWLHRARGSCEGCPFDQSRIRRSMSSGHNLFNRFLFPMPKRYMLRLWIGGRMAGDPHRAPRRRGWAGAGCPRCTHRQSTPPSVQIANGAITATVYLPDADCRFLPRHALRLGWRHRPARVSRTHVLRAVVHEDGCHGARLRQ